MFACTQGLCAKAASMCSAIQCCPAWQPVGSSYASLQFDCDCNEKRYYCSYYYYQLNGASLPCFSFALLIIV